MKKSKFKKYALMGMTSGLILANQGQVDAHLTQGNDTVVAAGCGGAKGGCGGRYSSQKPYIAEESTTTTTTTTHKNTKPMSESDLLSKLNAEGKSTYQNLNPEGKALALRMASEYCNGKSTCKGYSDYNEIVRAAAKKMVEKRGMMNRPSTTPSSMPNSSN